MAVLTGMALNFRKETLGGHTHVTVFAGPDEDHRANSGDLVFRKEEWDFLERWLFDAVASDPADAVAMIVTERIR